MMLMIRFVMIMHPHSFARADSAKTCLELGWTNTEKYGSSLVCGESDKLPGGCSGLQTYASAKALCESGFARLCTLEEMHDDEPRGSGCNYDFEELWTSTNCTLNGGLGLPGKMTGASSLGPHGNCTNASDLHHVRCCADHYPPSAEPTASPAPTRGNDVATVSSLTCVDLEWTNRLTFGFDEVHDWIFVFVCGLASTGAPFCRIPHSFSGPSRHHREALLVVWLAGMRGVGQRARWVQRCALVPGRY